MNIKQTSALFKICPYCGKRFEVKNNTEFKRRKYCSRKCCNTDPLHKKFVGEMVAKAHARKPVSDETKEKIRNSQVERLRVRHEIWLDGNAIVKSGHDKTRYELDITRRELEKYREEHKVCEICGRKEVATSPNGKVIDLAADHDHSNGHFRGLLCKRCNRALGWYETYSDNIHNYLNLP